MKTQIITTTQDISKQLFAILSSFNNCHIDLKIIDSDGDEEIPHDILFDQCQQHYDDQCGNEIYVFNFGIIHDDPGQGFWFDAATDITEFLSYWDTDDTTFEDLIAAFGIEPELEEVSQDYSGSVKIWVSPNYYQNQCNSPASHWWQEKDNQGFPTSEIKTFKSVKKANKAIKKLRNYLDGYYLLSHGEYSAPDFKLVEA